MTTVVATPGQGPDRPQEVSYTDIKVGNNINNNNNKAFFLEEDYRTLVFYQWSVF